MDERFTPSGVRLRRRRASPGALNWLLLPGGPGLGSESLYELANAMAVPGEVWAVDLPGDGSNLSTAPAPFARWPDVLLEAVDALPNCVYLGHSTGGMYLLSVPELEARLAGLALVSSAPNAEWRHSFAAMTQRHPLPAVERATVAYEAEKTNDRLRDLAVASAEWNFTPAAVERGRDLLRRMPYNLDAVEWSARAFDDSYVSRWWPRALPTLILSGADDRIVDQSLWQHPAFCGPNVLHRAVAQAGHFPWIEQPAAVGAALDELAAKITSERRL
jgi:pimeloyl-ACP methyl ester carboxylesterase